MTDMIPKPNILIVSNKCVGTSNGYACNIAQNIVNSYRYFLLNPHAENYTIQV